MAKPSPISAELTGSCLVLDGARRDWRVQAHRTRGHWFSGVLKPNAMRPTCLTIRFYASVQG